MTLPSFHIWPQLANLLAEAVGLISSFYFVHIRSRISVKEGLQMERECKVGIKVKDKSGQQMTEK